MSGAGAPCRVLELRSVRGTGGGPEKTILHGARPASGSEVQVTVCYVRDERDRVFAMDRRARAVGVDYLEVTERHSFDLRVVGRLEAEVRRRHIDVVHSHEYKTDLFALLLARRCGVVPLATAHGWTGQTRRERWLYYPADRRLLARFPTVIAVSREIARTLIRAGVSARRVRVVLNGIDPQAFVRRREDEAAARASFGYATGDVVIGAVGRLEPQKRFDLLLEAFAQVAPSRPHVHLAIAGDGSLRPRLEQLAQRLGIDSRCRLLGHCDDVIRFHHALSLFVQSSEYEGTPNVVLEAMALETPVVATDAGGTADILTGGQHGTLVPSRDPAALARAVAEALDAPHQAAVRAAAARRHVETHLSFDQRTSRVNNICRSLVDARRA